MNQGSMPPVLYVLGFVAVVGRIGAAVPVSSHHQRALCLTDAVYIGTPELPPLFECEQKRNATTLSVVTLRHVLAARSLSPSAQTCLMCLGSAGIGTVLGFVASALP